MATIAPEQQEIYSKIKRLTEILKASEGAIRPHCILTGPSGSGKSHLIESLAEEMQLSFFEINAAQLTKEGTAGNSLSKALAPLKTIAGPCICFVDEFDKLFISGNSNGDIAHEVTTGVQNEFLRVLESESTSVFGDYGKYITVPVDNCLFIFAGAFNGETDMTLDKLRNFGLKTEFLGRVSLLYNLDKLSLDSLQLILDHSELLENYSELFPKVDLDIAKEEIMKIVHARYEQNTLGIRMLNSLIHQYFINDGKITDEQVARTTFSKKLEFVA